MPVNQFSNAGCTGKQGFPNPWEARRTIHRKAKQKTTAIYRCEYCGKWHVGHVDRKRRLHGRTR
jgi:hypothetical protein